MLKKKQVVANCHTLGQACAALSRIVDDGRSPEDWFATLSLQSVYWLETLPDREVNRIIQEIDEGSMFTT